MGGSRQYIIHTHAPRFIAEIFDDDAGGNEIGEFEFIDKPPLGAAKLAKLARQAGEALNRYDRNLSVDRREAMRREIEESGMSIPEIAHLAKINTQTIYNYLAGRSDMTISLYDRVIDVFFDY